jgi:2'-hydroxyisoflavone reductase
MRVLILGGTQFVGRHMAEALASAGHVVSILNRGKTPDDLSIPVERLRGDRDDGPLGLQALSGRSWDACVDVSGYTPRQVRPSAEFLRGRVTRYVYVSTVSVYVESDDRPVRETHPLLAPAAEDVTDVNGETYGPLKVTCESIVEEVYRDRGTILRPQIIAGPHDPTGRYTYWAHRAVRGGEMLMPGDGTDHVQVIDARDLARFTRTLLEDDRGGTFNLAGPRLTREEFGRVLGVSEPVWVGAEILDAHGVTWQELPLFRQERGERGSLMDVNADLARAAGLAWTDPEVTAKDTQAWSAGKETSPPFTPEREATLIQAARAHAGAGR